MNRSEKNSIQSHATRLIRLASQYARERLKAEFNKIPESRRGDVLEILRNSSPKTADTVLEALGKMIELRPLTSSSKTSLAPPTMPDEFHYTGVGRQGGQRNGASFSEASAGAANRNRTEKGRPRFSKKELQSLVREVHRELHIRSETGDGSSSNDTSD